MKSVELKKWRRCSIHVQYTQTDTIRQNTLTNSTIGNGLRLVKEALRFVLLERMVSSSVDRNSIGEMHFINTCKPCENEWSIGTIGTSGKGVSRLVNHCNSSCRIRRRLRFVKTSSPIAALVKDYDLSKKPYNLYLEQMVSSRLVYHYFVNCISLTRVSRAETNGQLVPLVQMEKWSVDWLTIGICISKQTSWLEPSLTCKWNTSFFNAWAETSALHMNISRSLIYEPKPACYTWIYIFL